MRVRVGVATVICVCAACACGTDVPMPPPRSADTASHRALERPIAERHEAQVLLDSARVVLPLGRRQLAVDLLHRAASFYVAQSSAPPTTGSADLLAAAHSLDAAATVLARGDAMDVTRLDRISAHVNLAEAERHGALATVAWSTHSMESICDELTMAVDHVERAAVDGSLILPTSTRDVLAEIHQLVRTLATVRGLDVHSLDEPLASLHVEVAALHRRLEQADAAAAALHPVRSGERRRPSPHATGIMNRV